MNLKEIEFLDLNGLSEYEKNSLLSALSPVSRASSWERNSQESPEGALISIVYFAHYFTKAIILSLDVLPNAAEEKPRQVVQDVNPCPGFPMNGGVQGMYPTNICLPQYRPINYPVAMLSGTHLISPSPNYYIGNMSGGMGVNPAASYGQNQLPYGHQPYNFMKKKNVRGGKQFVRKELPNRSPIEGYPNMVYPPGLVATCFPGSMVQAATGVPIVMHQTMPSYMSSGNIHVPPIPVTNQDLIYPVSNVPVCAPPVVQPDHQTPIIEHEIVEHPVDPKAKSEIKFGAEPGFTPELRQDTRPEPRQEVRPEVRPESKPEARPESKPEVKQEAKPEIKSDVKSEAKIDTKPEGTLSSIPIDVVTPVDLTEKEMPLAAVESAETPSKSWASLFKKEAEAGQAIEKPTARVEPYTSLVDVKTQSPAKAPEVIPKIDVATQRLAKHLTSYEPPFTPLALLPRGLINKSNWCYINATLQALAACPLFVHLMKSLVPLVGAHNKEDSATPIISSM